MILYSLILIILLIIPLQIFCENNESFVSIQTQTGKITGRVEKTQIESGEIMNIDVFFGIPYAEPPIGDLRFEKTVPLEQNKTKTIYALEQPKVCVQHHRLDNWTWDWYQYSEDCLYLNLFAPHRIEGENEKLLPTLVLIYTGGFETQSMRRYKDYVDIGRKYLSKGIVVIAIQFRIGFLGFSSIGDPQLAGNFGYWDMAEALNWIRNNVEAFGGDPERITLFGYSAGSTAVTTLGVSPHTRDLFQQSIQMSGSIFTSRAANDRVISVSNHLFNELGCLANITQQVKECLKAKDVEEFFDAMDIIGSTIPDVNYDIFGPIMDNDFLPKDFTALISDTKPKPTILGVTEMDPLGYLLILGNNSLRHLGIPKDELNGFGINQFKNYLRQKIIKKEYFGDNSEEVVEHVSDFYLNYDKTEKLDNWFYLERIVHLMTDIQFIIPLATEIKNKQGWPLFIYINKYINKKLFPSEIKIKKNFHDNDHRYIFRNPYSDYFYDIYDLKMEALISDFVSNFVIYGNPSTNTILWPKNTDTKPFHHLNIDLKNNTIDESFPIERIKFWKEMAEKFPKYDLILGRGSKEEKSSSAVSPFRQFYLNLFLVLLMIILFLLY